MYKYTYDEPYRLRAKKNRSFIGNFFLNISKACKEFCLETNIHGFNHIAMPNRYFIERLLWIGITGSAIWGAISVSLGQWQRYNENPTVVTLEKDFRTWMFPLPGVTACDGNRAHPAKTSEVIKNLWDVSPGDDKFDYYKEFVQTVANSDLYHLDGFVKYADDKELEVDLFQITVDVVPENEVKTTWVENYMAKWTLVMTESGACYVTNSVAILDVALETITPNDTNMLPLNCKYASQSCYVTLEINTRVVFYIHSTYDVADMSSPPTDVYRTLQKKSEISVMESRCGPGVRDLSVSRRRCLYVDEPTETGKKVYSSNMCRRSCRNRLAVRLCGCKPFYNFHEEGVPCSTAGMACLSQHSFLLSSLVGENCTCMPPCVEATYKQLAVEEQIVAKGPFATRGSIKYSVQAPRTRYTREIVFHFQDLIVSFGGAAGLFLGASFLSFVEIFYFILEKIIFRGCLDVNKKKTVENQPIPPNNSTNTTGLRNADKHYQPAY